MTLLSFQLWVKLFFYKDDFSIKYPTKVNIKQRKQTQNKISKNLY